MERSIPAYKQGWSSFAQRFSPLQVANLYAFYRHYSNFRGYGNLIVPIEQWYDAAKEYPNDREAQEARFVAWYYGSNIPYSTTPPAPPVLNEDATYPPSFPCYHPTCNVTCRSRQYRDTHFFTQHFGEKNNFQCDIDGCENTYDYRQSLQRHQEREHGKLRSRRIQPT
ncbi:hypothetical protein F5880DRAFT_1280147 [Lentinula raphanica]|nr:hypothetical protein F5880DRAFT_1280147 [Lentinula raphanica]